MSNTNTQTVKDAVKTHTVVPFSTRDISCDKKVLVLKDKYKTTDPTKLMEEMGIRKNLSKDIFKKPEENWPTIRTALNSIDEQKRFGAIVNAAGVVVTLVAAPEEDSQLDYDKRIDDLMDSLDKANHDFSNIWFSPQEAKVRMDLTTRSQIDCGQGDLWKFGTSVDIDYNSQQFNNFFLRLICTNGMTTKENMAYRQLAKSDAVGQQFINFVGTDSASRYIIPRVTALKDSRASFYEVRSLTDNLTADQRSEFFPEYADIVNDYKGEGHIIEKMSSFRQKFVLTNENLYDVFNRATSLASHNRSTLTDQAVLGLNKAASDMFVKGPNVKFTQLDIYNN